MTRSRWPVFFSALALLWCAGWYCRGAGQGLFLVAAVASATAVARRRALPGTSRWVIWSSLLMAVVCLAADVERLMPPEDALHESRALDRVITAVFAVGLTRLFFRPSAHGVTLAALGGLSLAMQTLGRPEGGPGAVGPYALLLVWGTVFLLMAADLAQRLSRPQSAGEASAPGKGEMAFRVAALCGVAVLAFACRRPVESVARNAQRVLSGWMVFAERLPRRRASDLYVAMPAPANFASRMRVAALVDAPVRPGYLRENVFVRYTAGRWEVLRPATPLDDGAERVSAPRQTAYALPPARTGAAASVWRVEVLAPRLLSGFCLPGSGTALASAGPPPLAETNGTVAADGGVLPDAYSVWVAPGRVTDSAWPYPDVTGDAAYLAVPGALSGAVSNWVAWAGLPEARSVPEAVRRIEGYFATHFTYRLGVWMRSDPDPLLDFMTRKEGACSLFASAAALMFRSRGIPSRVVGGYVCGDWNPWLKRWAVRERDAHAWVEVWDGASGRWRVADPTPPEGNPAALRKPDRFRLALDLWTATWKRLFAYLKNAAFLEVLADVGAAVFGFLWSAVWSVPGWIAAAAFALAGWLRYRMRRRGMKPEERLRAELVLAMQKRMRRAVPAHLRRRTFESWEAWLARVGALLPPERLAALREQVEQYQALRYSVRLDEAAARVWLGAAGRQRGG